MRVLPKEDCLIPVVDCEPTPEIPPGASFWMPTEDDIPDDEGIGEFRDVWMILNEPIDVAREVIATETEYIGLIDRLADSVEDCEALAKILESGYPDELEPGPHLALLQRQAPHALERSEEDRSPLQGLEVGAAGLSYALSTIGAVPVASCRGHARGWSARPVVFVALDEQRARWIQPLVEAAGCGFDDGRDRGKFLIVEGPSIRHMNELAQRVVSEFDGRRELFARWLDPSVIQARYE